MATTSQQPTLPTNPPTSPDPAPPHADQPFTITGTPETGFELKYATGEIYKGKTERELLEANARGTHETKLSWRELKSELEQVREQIGPIADALKPKPPALTPQEIEEENMRLYLANQQAKYFGFGSAEEMKTTFGNMLQATQDQKEAMLAMSFQQACPEFPGTPEAIQKLTSSLDKFGIARDRVSLDHLKAAHAFCVQFGEYQPLTEEQIRASQGQAKPGIVGVRAQAPPMLPTSQPELTNAKNLWEMKPEEIRQAYFDRLAKGER